VIFRPDPYCRAAQEEAQHPTHLERMLSREGGLIACNMAARRVVSESEMWVERPRAAGHECRFFMS